MEQSGNTNVLTVALESVLRYLIQVIAVTLQADHRLQQRN
jgi:hypothetical protein